MHFGSWVSIHSLWKFFWSTGAGVQQFWSSLRQTGGSSLSDPRIAGVHEQKEETASVFEGLGLIPSAVIRYGYVFF